MESINYNVSISVDFDSKTFTDKIFLKLSPSITMNNKNTIPNNLCLHNNMSNDHDE